jgi:hypothetical protein
MVSKKPPLTLQTKKQACIVHVALVERNEAYINLIRDSEPPNSHEKFDACTKQAMLPE